eukprot:CAMPEP_0174855722 /NCGR_PEP_ID=MMETSP1114-20130205/34057_1 /TAXON_ID=312471 /ORGANISM="Neobodo designis, Strain CCAP 1951/1" /LENGTH=89 /DNA_ID=CAMNT_0016090483 /DNA_START=156 /DNA_END=425 /DNA_ORIENTATION=+
MQHARRRATRDKHTASSCDPRSLPPNRRCRAERQNETALTARRHGGPTESMNAINEQGGTKWANARRPATLLRESRQPPLRERHAAPPD